MSGLTDAVQRLQIRLLEATVEKADLEVREARAKAELAELILTEAQRAVRESKPTKVGPLS